MAMAACSSTVATDSTQPDAQGQADLYTLVGYSGLNLPASYTSGSLTTFITAGTLLLNADNSYSVSQTTYTAQNSGGTVTDTPLATNTIEAGTYQVTGTKIIFTATVLTQGTTYTHQGTISGSYVTYADSAGRNYEYQMLQGL